MIPAKELATMKTNMYAEEAVDLHLAYLNMMINVIQSAKYGDSDYTIFGDEYYEEDTPESCYVLDCFRESGYFINKNGAYDINGEYQNTTIISWRYYGNHK